jgi:hypothetical protein
MRPFAISLTLIAAAASLQAQNTPVQEAVRAIAAPRLPLPAENASADVTRYSFIAYGDTRGRRDGTEVQYEHSLIVDDMIRTIRRLANGPDPVRFILQTGDAVVDGGNAAQWNRSFVDLINRLTTDGGVPYFLAPGNHDVTSAADLESPRRARGLANYLAAMTNLIPPDGATRRLDGYPTYAFGYGNTFVLALDSNIAEDSVQLRWAEAQLRDIDRNRYRHVIAFFHHPAFSSGPHGGSIIERPTAAIRAHWMPVFRRHNVTLLLTGHEHLYEHWVERFRGTGGTQRRMDQIVTGGGGAPLYAYKGDPDLTAYHRGAAMADSARVQRLVGPGMEPGDNPYHYLVVHVDGADMWLEVISVDWGRGFAPYRSNRTTIGGGGTRP